MANEHPGDGPRIVEELLAERGDQYGGDRNLKLTGLLINTMMDNCAPGYIGAKGLYCIIMLLVKIARIATGKKTSWNQSIDDIIGYAELLRREINGK